MNGGARNDLAGGLGAKVNFNRGRIVRFFLAYLGGSSDASLLAARLCLLEVPSYLFVRLEKFQYYDVERRKVEEHMKFPIMALDILSVVHTSCRRQSSTMYHCTSNIEYIGDTLEVRHHITRKKRHNSNDWIDGSI